MILQMDLNYNGAVGYLWGEYELHEISKIYGYGYGSYSPGVDHGAYGGLLGESYKCDELSGTRLGSGARSIVLEDINKIAKIGETADGIEATESFANLPESVGWPYKTYGVIKNLEPLFFYPTISTTSGISSNAGLSSVSGNSYFYNILDRSEVSSTTKELLTGKTKSPSSYTDVGWNNYYIANRLVTVGIRDAENDEVSSIGCLIAPMYKGQVGISHNALCQFSATEGKGVEQQFVNKGFGIRTVVCIRSDCIDLTSSTTKGSVNNPWTLK